MHLLGSALEIQIGLSKNITTSQKGAYQVINAIYQGDALSHITEFHEARNDLLFSKCGTSESFEIFMVQFPAQLEEFNYEGRIFHNSIL